MNSIIPTLMTTNQNHIIYLMAVMVIHIKNGLLIYGQKIFLISIILLEDFTLAMRLLILKILFTEGMETQDILEPLLSLIFN